MSQWFAYLFRFVSLFLQTYSYHTFTYMKGINNCTFRCILHYFQLLGYLQGGPKVYDVIQRKSVCEILKYFLIKSSSLYIHIFSRSWSFLQYVEKKLWGIKNPENGSFLARQNFLKIVVNFFPFLNLLKGRYLIITKFSFYFTLLSKPVLKLYAF